MAASARLSLCMIARDSSRTLPDCLGSICPWVDELIVVDTGSTDRTREIAADFGAKVFDFPWCDDFSAARNESLRHATGDWLFWMDSDDTISPANGEQLRKLTDQPLENAPIAYVLQVHCPGPVGSTDLTIVDHVKMFRNDARLRFEGRIHEQILPAIKRIGCRIEWTDIYVTHSGSEHSPEARRQKQERDLRLLELELSEHPNHPFVLFNLGMTFADMDEPKRAVDYLKQSLHFASVGESHVRKVYALLVGCLTQISDDAEAMQILNRGQQLFPDDPELHFRRGILEHRAKNHPRAIQAYQSAIENRGERSYSSRDHGITGHKTRHNLAAVYSEIGELAHAELQWRLALHALPAYCDGWYGLVDALLEQKKYVTLEIEIETARERGLPAEMVACATARLEARRGNWAEAIRALDTQIGIDGVGLEPLRLKCQLLFENSKDDEAIAALEELCRQTPNDGAAWHNLGTAYQRSGCNALAVTCYQKSIAVRSDCAPTLVQLGYAQQALGRVEAARRVWKAAHEIAPNDPAVRAVFSSGEQVAILN